MIMTVFIHDRESGKKKLGGGGGGGGFTAGGQSIC